LLDWTNSLSYEVVNQANLEDRKKAKENANEEQNTAEEGDVKKRKESRMQKMNGEMKEFLTLSPLVLRFLCSILFLTIPLLLTQLEE